MQHETDVPDDVMYVDSYRVNPSGKYLVSSDGQIIFTEAGKSFLGPYFAKAGISLASIKTYKEYLLARRDAGPYFIEALYDHIRDRPKTDEYELLRSILIDPPDVYAEKLRKFDLKRSMKIVINKLEK